MSCSCMLRLFMTKILCVAEGIIQESRSQRDRLVLTAEAERDGARTASATVSTCRLRWFCLHLKAWSYNPTRLQWRRQVLQVEGQIFEGPSMEGPKVPCPPKNFPKKSTLKSRIFRHFCKLKWSLLRWRQGRIRQQALQNGPIKTSSNLQTHPRCPGCKTCLCPYPTPIPHYLHTSQRICTNLRIES